MLSGAPVVAHDIRAGAALVLAGLAFGALPAGSILAHGVWLDAAQVRHADASGWWLVQNPRSNRANRVGYPRAIGERAPAGRKSLRPRHTPHSIAP